MGWEEAPGSIPDGCPVFFPLQVKRAYWNEGYSSNDAIEKSNNSQRYCIHTHTSHQGGARGGRVWGGGIHIRTYVRSLYYFLYADIYLFLILILYPTEHT